MRISNLKCEDPTGFPSLNLESSDLDTIFYPDISSDLQLSKFPLLKDPLEDLYVEVRPSTIKAAGEGLFLKKAAKAGTVVGFFNGVRVNVHDTLRNPEYEVTPYKVWNDWDDNDELLSILNGKKNCFQHEEIKAGNLDSIQDSSVCRFFKCYCIQCNVRP